MGSDIACPIETPAKARFSRFLSPEKNFKIFFDGSEILPHHVSAMKIQSFEIKRNPKTGERFVRLSNGRMIPAGIAGMCTGPDKWLSEIRCKCRTCGEMFPLRELGETGQWCETCACVGIED